MFSIRRLDFPVTPPHRSYNVSVLIRSGQIYKREQSCKKSPPPVWSLSTQTKGFVLDHFAALRQGGVGEMWRFALRTIVNSDFFDYRKRKDFVLLIKCLHAFIVPFSVVVEWFALSLAVHNGLHLCGRRYSEPSVDFIRWKIRLPKIKSHFPCGK